MRIAVLLFVGALVLSGCQDGGPSVARPDPASGLTEQQAIATVLKRLGPDVVTSASFNRALPSPANEAVPILTVHVPATQQHDSRAAWQGELAAAAIGELVHTDQGDMAQVLSYRLRGQMPDGEGQALGGGSGGRLGTVFRSSGQSDEDIVDGVRSVLDEYGLTPVSVDVLHPIDPAVAVVATAPADLRPDWTTNDLVQDLGGDGRQDVLEGLFLELRSPTGGPLVRAWTVGRLREGGEWSRDAAQQDRFGIEASIPYRST